LGSDLKKVDSHVIKPEEYEEIPELTEEMVAQAVFRKAGRPRSVNPRQMIKRLEKLPLPRVRNDP
jgi:hypothetical protein